MKRGRPVWLYGALASLACALLCAPWPDDWDGVGFVRSLRAFDVRAFVPHAPGYPGWVLLARALHALLPVRDAVAASLVSALSLGTLVVALGALRPRSAPWLAALCLGAPLVSLAGTSVGTDLPGLALACTALACTLRANPLPVLAGLCAGAALMVRPSALPVACALALCAAWGARAPLPARRAYARFSLGFSLPLLACALFVYALHPGPLRAYLDACVAQWRGHFGAWGNAATTDPHALSRAARFAWNASLDGLGVALTPSGALRFVAFFAALGAGLYAMPARERRAWALFVALASAWGILAQNVSSPRHALPVCVALAWAAAHGVSHLARSRTGLLTASLVSLGWVAWPTAPLLWEHHTRPPPGLALASHITHRTERDALLFGARSARYAELLGLATLPRAWMGEVDGALERLDHLPRAVFVTSEVRHRERTRGELTWVATACRDPRLERGRDACLALYRYVPR